MGAVLHGRTVAIHQIQPHQQPMSAPFWAVKHRVTGVPPRVTRRSFVSGSPPGPGWKSLVCKSPRPLCTKDRGIATTCPPPPRAVLPLLLPVADLLELPALLEKCKPLSQSGVVPTPPPHLPLKGGRISCPSRFAEKEHRDGCTTRSASAGAHSLSPHLGLMFEDRSIRDPPRVPCTIRAPTVSRMPQHPKRFLGPLVPGTIDPWGSGSG